MPACAAAHGDRLRQQRVDRGIPAKERKRMPETGYFAAADPHGMSRNFFVHSIYMFLVGP